MPNPERLVLVSLLTAGLALTGSCSGCEGGSGTPTGLSGPTIPENAYGGRRPEKKTLPAATKFVPHPDSELELTREARQHLLEVARLWCEGNGDEAKAKTAPAGLETTKPVIVVLYAESGGRTTSLRIDDDKTTLPAKLEANMPRLCAEHDPGDHFIHLQVVSYTARMPNFGIKGLFEYKVFEPQVTGIAMEVDGKRHEMDPLRQLELNYGPKTTRSKVAAELGMGSDGAFVANNDVILEFYRTIHIGERYPDRRFTNYHRGHEVFTAEDLTEEILQERIKLIGDWYRNNVIDGEVTYKYRPGPRKYANNERTMVRSTMATWVLNRLAFYLGDDDLKKKGQEVIDFYLTRYFQIEESRKAGSIQPSPTPLKNGNLVKNRYTTASFIASAILERDDWEQQKGDVELLMAYAMSQTRDDNVLWTQFAQSQYFMPGQLLLAVSYAYEKTKDAKYKAYFDRVWGTYSVPISQMMYLGNDAYFPLAPAWYTQPLASMYHQTKEDAHRDMVFEINDRVERVYQLNALNQVYFDYDGAMTPKLGYWGNNSVTAAALESIADAAIVAQEAGDTERLEKYRHVVRRAVAYLLRLQYTPTNTYYLRNRERIIGGFKTDIVNTHVWMDNVWHLTSAFIKIKKAGLLAE